MFNRQVLTGYIHSIAHRGIYIYNIGIPLRFPCRCDTNIYLQACDRCFPYIHYLYSVLFYTRGVWCSENRTDFSRQGKKKNIKKDDTRIACFPGTAAAVTIYIYMYNNKICTHNRRTVERFIVVAKKRRRRRRRRLYNII